MIHTGTFCSNEIIQSDFQVVVLIKGCWIIIINRESAPVYFDLMISHWIYISISYSVFSLIVLYKLMMTLIKRDDYRTSLDKKNRREVNVRWLLENVFSVTTVKEAFQKLPLWLSSSSFFTQMRKTICVSEKLILFTWRSAPNSPVWLLSPWNETSSLLSKPVLLHIRVVCACWLSFELLNALWATRVLRMRRGGS